jgi:hypothetical protein
VLAASSVARWSGAYEMLAKVLSRRIVHQAM